MTSVIVGESFACEMEAMFERDFEHSAPIDPAAWDENSIWWRIGVQLSHLAAPVL